MFAQPLKSDFRVALPLWRVKTDSVPRHSCANPSSSTVWWFFALSLAGTPARTDQGPKSSNAFISHLAAIQYGYQWFRRFARPRFCRHSSPKVPARRSTRTGANHRANRLAGRSTGLRQTAARLLTSCVRRQHPQTTTTACNEVFALMPALNPRLYASLPAPRNRGGSVLVNALSVVPAHPAASSLSFLLPRELPDVYRLFICSPINCTVCRSCSSF